MIGAESTISPTVEGIAINIEKRMAVLTLFNTWPLSLDATARDREGISEDDRALAMATGIINNVWYLPKIPHWAAIRFPLPSLSIPCPKKKLSSTELML